MENDRKKRQEKIRSGGRDWGGERRVEKRWTRRGKERVKRWTRRGKEREKRWTRRGKEGRDEKDEEGKQMEESDILKGRISHRRKRKRK